MRNDRNKRDGQRGEIEDEIGRGKKPKRQEKRSRDRKGCTEQEKRERNKNREETERNKHRETQRGTDRQT